MIIGKRQNRFDSTSALAAEKRRLDNAVSSETEKIDGLYQEIGKQFVKSNAENIPADYAEKFEAIQKTKNSLSAHYAQLQLLNGYIVCPKCGKNAPSGSAFCNHCGTKLPELDTTRFLTCKNCGKTVWEDMGQCVFCGAPLRENAQLRCKKCGQILPSGTAFCTACGTPTNAALPAPQENGKKICPKCGTVLPNEMLFCTECGQKL